MLNVVILVMKTLYETRAFVFEKLNVYFDVESSKDIESSIIGYSKAHCVNKLFIYDLKWSDIRLRRVYLRKYRHIMFNIQEISNLIKNNDILPSEVGYTHHEVWKPELYKPIHKKFQDRELNTIMYDKREQVVEDGLLNCERCRSKKTKYIQLQTRSADEPMTVFAICTECDHHWSDNGK